MDKPVLNYNGYTGSIEVSIEDNCVHGKILFIDDLITYESEVVQEIEASFKAAVDRYLAYCERIGKPANKQYSGSFNVRTGPELHREVCKTAHRKGVSLNEFVCQSLSQSIIADGVAKVEHTHNHQHVVVSVERVIETRVSGTGAPQHWEKKYAEFTH